MSPLFDCISEISVQSNIESIKTFEIREGQENYFLEEYSPDDTNYILIACEDGWVIVGLPKDKN